MAKFAFKYHKAATGLAAIGNRQRGSYIKLKGNVVGEINAPSWRTEHNNYTISLCIIDPDHRLGWRWITLKYVNENEKELRKWLQDNTNNILEKYELHVLENYGE